MEHQPIRRWVLYGVGGFLVSFVSWFFLFYSRFHFPNAEGFTPLALPSVLVLGLMIAAGLRFMGVTLRLSSPLDGIAALFIFIIAYAVSKTPWLLGYDRAGTMNMAIYTAVFAAMLLVASIEGLYRGDALTFHWKSALVYALAMGVCILAQWVNTVYMDTLLQDNHTMLPQDLGSRISRQLIPLLCTGVVGVVISRKIGSIYTDSRVGGIMLLSIGGIGILARIAVQILPWLASGSKIGLFSLIFSGSLIGVAATDALTYYLILALSGIKMLFRMDFSSWLRSKRARAKTS